MIEYNIQAPTKAAFLAVMKDWMNTEEGDLAIYTHDIAIDMSGSESMGIPVPTVQAVFAGDESLVTPAVFSTAFHVKIRLLNEDLKDQLDNDLAPFERRTSAEMYRHWAGTTGD